MKLGLVSVLALALLSAGAAAGASPSSSSAKAGGPAERSNSGEATTPAARAEADEAADTAPCFVVLPLASASAEAERLTQLGLQEFLLGSKGRAEEAFRRASECDSRAMLARAALLALRTLKPEEEQGVRAELEALMASGLMTTPPEEAMLGWLLALSVGQTDQARQINDAWAEGHRRDPWSQCWRLLEAANHTPTLLAPTAAEDVDVDSAEDVAEDPEEVVDEVAEEAADQPENAGSDSDIRTVGRAGGEGLGGSFEAVDAELGRLFPNHPLVCFCRAQVREASPDEGSRALALDQARRAAEQLPSHPLVQLLLVHALDRAGQTAEAERVLSAARRRLYPEVPPEGEKAERELWLLLSLRDCSLLSSLGREAEALKLRRQLNALPLPESGGSTDVLLLHWESHFMPLRALLRPGARLTRSLIRAARRAAAPEKAEAAPESGCLVCAADGLEHALLGLLYLNRGERSAAEAELRSLEASIAAMEKIHLPAIRTAGQTDELLLAQRQLDSLRAARYRVLIRLYPDQAEDLQRDGDELLRQRLRYQLPPLIPLDAVPSGSRGAAASRRSTPRR